MGGVSSRSGQSIRARPGWALRPTAAFGSGTVTGFARLPIVGVTARPLTGSNFAIWNPGGAQWTPSLKPELSSNFPLQIVGHTERPGVLFASNNVSLLRSEDFGASWRAIAKVPGLNIVWCLSDPARLYAWESSLLRISVDQGETWSAVSDPTAISGQSISQFVVSAADADSLAIRTGNFETFLSSDGGKTWSRIPEPTSPPRSLFVALDSDAQRRLLSIDTVSGDVNAYTADGWRKIGELPAPYKGYASASFSYFPGSRGMITVANFAGGLILSQDYGQSWSEMTACKSESRPCRLWINPGVSNEWWLTDGRVLRSTDSGGTWQTILDPAIVPVTSVAFSGKTLGPVVASTHVFVDIYLQKLTPDWRQPEFASYWGGTFDDGPAGLLVDSQGRLNLVASAYSPDYPVTPDALQSGFAGIQGVALTRFSTTGEPEFSATWGGSYVQVYRARLTSEGSIVWCGASYGSDVPALVEPIEEPLSGFSRNAFAGGYDPATGAWLPGYLFGGQGSTVATDCDITTANGLVLTGFTDSPTFPLVKSTLPSSGVGPRAFVSLIQPKRPSSGRPRPRGQH